MGGRKSCKGLRDQMSSVRLGYGNQWGFPNEAGFNRHSWSTLEGGSN